MALELASVWVAVRALPSGKSKGAVLAVTMAPPLVGKSHLVQMLVQYWVQGMARLKVPTMALATVEKMELAWGGRKDVK